MLAFFNATERGCKWLGGRRGRIAISRLNFEILGNGSWYDHCTRSFEEILLFECSADHCVENNVAFEIWTCSCFAEPPQFHHWGTYFFVHTSHGLPFFCTLSSLIVTKSRAHRNVRRPIDASTPLLEMNLPHRGFKNIEIDSRTSVFRSTSERFDIVRFTRPT